MSFMSFMLLHSESARAYPIGRRSEGLEDVGPTLSLRAFPVALYAAVGLTVVGDVEFCCPKIPKKCSESDDEKWEEIRVILTPQNLPASKDCCHGKELRKRRTKGKRAKLPSVTCMLTRT